MKTIEEYQQFLHTDPETLPGVPSNADIIASKPDLTRWARSLTDGERSGFLQLWQMGEVRRHMNDLSVVELQSLRDETSRTLDSPNMPIIVDELRILQGIAAVATGKVN